MTTDAFWSSLPLSDWAYLQLGGTDGDPWEDAVSHVEPGVSPERSTEDLGQWPRRDLVDLARLVVAVDRAAPGLRGGRGWPRQWAALVAVVGQGQSVADHAREVGRSRSLVAQRIETGLRLLRSVADYRE